MLFTSYAFIAFIAVAFFLYYRIPRKWQWPFLLIISIGFYASAGIFYPIFLLVSSAVTYLAGLWIERNRKQEKTYIRENAGQFASRQEKKEFKQKGEKRRRNLMVSALLILLAVLGVFKYADFVIDNMNAVFYAVGSDRELEYLDLLLPMGISFYTFQSLGYLLDVYWEKIDAQKNFFKHLLFVSFFPQLVQGPISRYSDLSQTLYEEHVFDKKQVIFGLERILWGYFKKLVVADTILTAITAVIGDEYYNGAWVLVGIIFYGIELYADFTGGIDITIGIAQVFGVKVAENFIRPYFSKNIAEYWRRWHISMGTWFRDYIFYPMSISKRMGKLTKFCKTHFGKGVAKRVPVYLATMVTWFATGIWHGASWNFVVWGLLNSIIMLVSQELKPLYEKADNRLGYRKLKYYKVFEIIRTTAIVCCLQMLDYYRDIAEAFRMFFSMFTSVNYAAVFTKGMWSIGLSAADYIVIFAGVVIMFAVSLLERKCPVRDRLAKKNYIIRYTVFLVIFLLIAVFGIYGTGYESSQFIYNQF